jgi:hypothetical protein
MLPGQDGQADGARQRVSQIGGGDPIDAQGVRTTAVMRGPDGGIS